MKIRQLSVEGSDQGPHCLRAEIWFGSQGEVLKYLNDCILLPLQLLQQHKDQEKSSEG